MKWNRKLRSDGYEACLTPEERVRLHGWLLEPGLSLEAVRKRAPRWRGGKYKGKPPSDDSLSKIARRVRTARVLASIRKNMKMSRADVEEVLGTYYRTGDIQEEFFEEVMMAIAQEVIQKTVKGKDPQARTAAARLLLSQEELKLKRERFERETRKGKAEERARKKKEKAEAETKPTGDGSVPKEVFDRFAEELKLI